MASLNTKNPALQEALSQPWPVAGSELFAKKSGKSNTIDSPNLLLMLLGEAVAKQRINLRSAILPQLHHMDDSLVLSQKIMNRLAFTDLYYEQLARHTYVDPDILGLLQQLRPTVIRSLLNSDSFLTHPRHPLHVVLDDICEWGIGWDHDLGKNGATYLEQLKQLAAIGNTVTEEMIEVPPEYAAHLEALEELTERYRKVEARVCQSEQASMESLAVRRHIETVINDHVAGKSLPPPAVAFFHNTWRDILHRLYVVNGPKSKEWTSALQLTDKLVFCVVPNPERKQEQSSQIAAAIQSVKAILQKTSSDAGSLHQFDELIAIFKKVLTGETLPLQPALALTSLEMNGVATTISSSIAQQVNQLKPGQWILSRTDGEGLSRAKLATTFPDAGQLLFVNLLGAKPFTRSIEEVGLALNTKRAHLLVSKKLSSIALTITVDLFVKDYLKATNQHTPVGEQETLRKQSAEKALAEAKRLRETAAAKQKPTPAPATPLPAEESGSVTAKVNALTIGSWLSMKNRLGEQMPCKVAVIYPSTGKMVIVDKSGLRVGEFMRPDLAKLIMKGEASIMEVSDSFESSLSRVIHSLRKNP